MRYVSFGVAMFTCLVGATAPAAAQTSAAQPYLAAGAQAVIHPAGNLGSAHVSPPLKGHTWAGAVGAGVFVMPEVAVEVETVWPGTISMPQEFSYNWREQYIAGVRDRLVLANLRYRPDGLSYIEVFGGAGLAFSRYSRRDVVETQYFPTRTRELADGVRDERAWAWQVGASLTVAVSPRVRLVPQGAVRWIHRDQNGEAYHLHASDRIWSAGVNLRIALTR